MRGEDTHGEGSVRTPEEFERNEAVSTFNETLLFPLEATKLWKVDLVTAAVLLYELSIERNEDMGGYDMYR